jgi:hypothetical protein
VAFGASKGVGTCIECGNFVSKPLEFVLNFAPEAREDFEKLKR